MKERKGQVIQDGIWLGIVGTQKPKEAEIYFILDEVRKILLGDNPWAKYSLKRTIADLVDDLESRRRLHEGIDLEEINQRLEIRLSDQERGISEF